MAHKIILNRVSYWYSSNNLKSDSHKLDPNLCELLFVPSLYSNWAQHSWKMLMLLHKKMWGLGVFRAHDPDCCCYKRNPSIFKSLQYRDNACDGHTNICALGVCLCYHLFMYLIFANVEQCISLYSCTFLDLSIKLDIDFNISSAGI